MPTPSGVGRGGELPNPELVKLILNKLGKPESLISFVTDRLGHDRRYVIDSSSVRRRSEIRLSRNNGFARALL